MTWLTFVMDRRTLSVLAKALQALKAGQTGTVTHITMGSQEVAQKVVKQ